MIRPGQLPPAIQQHRGLVQGDLIPIRHLRRDVAAEE